MIRGTTAQFRFKLPCRFDELISATIIFWQERNDSKPLSITRKKDQCSVATDDPCCLCVSLEPDKTMLFSDKLKAKVQLRAQYGGTIFASRQQLITVYPIDESIVEPDYPEPDNDNLVILDGEEIG